MLMHAAVGALWAVFYAYFFWSMLDWRPTARGLVFSLLPSALALFIAYRERLEAAKREIEEAGGEALVLPETARLTLAAGATALVGLASAALFGAGRDSRSSRTDIRLGASR